MPDYNVEAYIRKITEQRPQFKHKVIERLAEHYGWPEERARMEVNSLISRRMAYVNWENKLVWGR